MDVTPLIREDRQVIQSYAGGRFRISGIVYESPVIVTPSQTLIWDTKRSVSEMGKEDFRALANMAGELDVVLLGCGARPEFLPPELKKSLNYKGLSIDTMDTGAACRTYNVLMAESRRVAAALLPA